MDLLPYVSQQVNKVLQMMALRGHPMKVSSSYRSFSDQDDLYEQGRTTPGNIVTNARGGYSWHNYKVAVDCCFTTGEPFGDGQPWEVYGQVAKSFGFEWGGEWTTFKDRPHIQMTYGQDIGTLAHMGEIRAITRLTSLDEKKMDNSKISPWAQEAVDKAKATGIIINWVDPQAIVTPETLEWVLYKLGGLKQRGVPMTLERLACALNELHLLKTQ